MHKLIKSAIELGQPIAIVCDNNTCRSPIIAGLLRRHFAGDAGISIVSAGYMDGAGEHKQADLEWLALQGASGINLSRHQSRHITELKLSSIGAFVAVEEKVRDALVQAGVERAKIILIEVSNPFTVRDIQAGARLQAYRECLHDAEMVVADLVN